MKVSIAAIILICLSYFWFADRNAKSAADSYKYELEWVEDFESSSMDARNWGFMPRRQSDAGRYFSESPKLYDIKKGRLRLYARRNKGIAANDTAPVLTCGFETFRKRTITYGKVEVRARMKCACGAWPAIWLRGQEDRYSTYPDYAEIDIMEHLNYDKSVYQTVHSNYTDKLQLRHSPKAAVEVNVDPTKYNVYAVEIRPDMLVFSVNGNVTLEYPKIETGEYGQYPFGCAKHLMVDMQYGGKWVGLSDPSTLPAYIDIDWVKFYKLIKQ